MRIHVYDREGLEGFHCAHDAVDIGDFVNGYILLVVFFVGGDKTVAAFAGASAEALDGAMVISFRGWGEEGAYLTCVGVPYICVVSYVRSMTAGRSVWR